MRNTKVITRTLAAATVLMGAAVGCTSSSEGPGASPTNSPASPSASPGANPTKVDDFSGTYTVTFEDGLSRIWTATPCGPGCASVVQAPKPFDEKAQARLNGHQWTIEFFSPTGVECDGGSVHPGTQTWTWDTGTLQGTYYVEQDAAPCGGPVHEPFDEHPFTLTKS